MKRIPGLDFLRGVAILLVMVHHFEFTPIMTRGGWAGVDLFFVLSGFLVGGLLLNEYELTGRIRPILFLGRRGFKIYPLFYTALLFHLLYFFMKGMPVTSGQVLAEVFFVQNYFPGLMGISWSLAVEEHFYFLLAVMFFLTSRKRLPLSGNAIPVVVSVIACVCFFLRILAYSAGDYTVIKNDFPTHLRLDSPAVGVLLAYWFTYYRVQLRFFFKENWVALLVIAGICLVPIFTWNRGTFIVSIFGHLLLYISSGILVCMMVLFPRAINRLVAQLQLQWVFGNMVRLGYYSYGIYLFHFKVGPIVSNAVRTYTNSAWPEFVYLVIYLLANIVAGVVVSRLIELPFLRLREKWLPAKQQHATMR